MKPLLPFVALFFSTFCLAAQAEERAPIIDMHLHAIGDPAPLIKLLDMGDFDLSVPTTGKALLDETLAELKRYNIVYAVANGTAEDLAVWNAVDPKRFISAVQLHAIDGDEAHAAALKPLFESGELEAFGEMGGLTCHH